MMANPLSTKRWLALAAKFVACGVVSCAQAQTIDVSPITVELPNGRAASSVSITNRGDTPRKVQIRPFRWEQREGADVLSSTQDAVVSPPFALIGRGETQLVRIVLRRPATGTEASYRLLIDELPGVAAPGMISVALRISLPVFAEPSTAAVPVLQWRYVGVDGHLGRLLVRNVGAARVRLYDIHVTVGGHDLAIRDPAFIYVLPGSEMSLPVSTSGLSAHGSSSVAVAALSDRGPVSASVPASPSD